jgi:hypothetical protein
MADRSALGTIGLLLGMTAIAVTIMASVVVAEHVTGRLHLDGSAPEAVAATVLR